MRKKSTFYLESSEGWDFPDGLYSQSSLRAGTEAVLGVMSSSRSIAQLDFSIFPEGIVPEPGLGKELKLEVWQGNDQLLAIVPEVGLEVKHLRLYFGVAQGKNPIRFSLNLVGQAVSKAQEAKLPIKFNRLRRLAAP